MTAFVVVHATIKDPEKFQAYAAASRPTLAPFGGEFAFRGKLAQVLAGEHGHELTGVIRFPDQAAVRAWYDSPAYQALVAERDQAADMVFISCEQPPD